MPGIVNKDYSNKTENNAICCSQKVGNLDPGGVVCLSGREGTVKGPDVIGSKLLRLPYQELKNLKNHIIKIEIRIVSWEDPHRIWCWPCFYFIYSAVKRYDALAALGAAGMVDIQNLVKWIGKFKDPLEIWLFHPLMWKVLLLVKERNLKKWPFSKLCAIRLLFHPAKTIDLPKASSQRLDNGNVTSCHNSSWRSVMLILCIYMWQDKDQAPFPLKTRPC